MKIAYPPVAMKEFDQIFFSQSSKMVKIKGVIDEIAKTDLPILIKGESGTGKGVVAEAIHLRSQRRDKPLIKVNCAAIPKELLESELLGFEKGAFTGAHLNKPGKFELADQGTIFLSEIGEIDISTQAKLLQVLQDGTFSRLGGEGDIRVDARVITTTRGHLEVSVMEGTFREDLYFRINVMTINIPPLRDRREQILPLSEYFFNLYRKKYKKAISELSPRTMHYMRDYSWPGNIRELDNLIKRIVILGDEEIVFKDALNNESDKTELTGKFSSNGSKEISSYDLKEVGRRAAEDAEKAIIETTLRKTHWNRKVAAELLRVSYKALLYKIQKYHLDDQKRLGMIEEKAT